MLVTRANYYLALGHYRKALGDTKQAAHVGDLAPEVLMDKCVALERLRGFVGKAQACYEHVLSIYENRDSDAAYPSANHVVVALLAQSEIALELKKKFLAKSERPKRFKQLIKVFDRERFIHDALPE